MAVDLAQALRKLLRSPDCAKAADAERRKAGRLKRAPALAPEPDPVPDRPERPMLTPIPDHPGSDPRRLAVPRLPWEHEAR
jgi:hypothetical protein